MISGRAGKRPSRGIHLGLEAVAFDQAGLGQTPGEIAGSARGSGGWTKRPKWIERQSEAAGKVALHFPHLGA